MLFTKSISTIERVLIRILRKSLYPALLASVLLFLNLSLMAPAWGQDITPPSAPSFVTADIDPGTGLLRVSWGAATDHVGVKGYNIYLNGASHACADFSLQPFILFASPSGADSIGVSAFDAAGNEGPILADFVGGSPPTTTTTTITVPDGVPPSAPSSVTANVLSSTSINVTWGAATDNVGVALYNIYLNGAWRACVSFGQQPFFFLGLTPGPGNVSVSALDAAGNEGPLLSDNFNTSPSTTTTTTTTSTTTTTTMPKTISDALPNLPPNEQSVATTLDTVSASGLASPGLQARYDELLASTTSSPGGVGNILGQITHEKISSQGSTSVDIAYTNVDIIVNRLVALRGGAKGISMQGLAIIVEGERFPTHIFTNLLTDGGSSYKASTEKTSIFSKLGVFVNGEISFGDKDQTILESGFHFNTYGITGGVDYRFTDNIILGTALGYERIDVSIDSGGGNPDSEGITVSLFGTYNVKDKFYIDGIASLGFNDFDSARNIVYSIPNQLGGITSVNQRLDGDTDGTQYSFSLGGGYDFNHKAFTFGPYGRVTYIRTDIDSFTEDASAPGAPGSEWRLEIESQDIKSLTTILGGQASYAISTRWAVFMPQARVEWEHEYSNNSRLIKAAFVEDAGGVPFAVSTDDPDRDYLNFGIGISAVFAGGKTAFIDYEKTLGFDDWTSNTITFGLRLEF